MPKRSRSAVRKKQPAPPFTTGLVACVWYRDEEHTTDTPQELKLVGFEQRLEQAMELFEQLEDRLDAIEAKAARAERRFSALQDAFLKLYQDWRPPDEADPDHDTQHSIS